MEHSEFKDEQDGPWSALVAIMAERGAWRLRSTHQGQEITLDTLLGRLHARDASMVEAIRAVRHVPAHAVFERIDNDVCVESLPPVIAQGSRALATAGTVSAHAFELVAAALDMGRNVLCAGPYAAAWPVMAAWLDSGHHPAVLSHLGSASPGWQRLSSAEQALRWGADRIGVWGVPPKHVARSCGRLSGVVAHIESHGLERALMRFEQAIGKSGALGVLSAIDLVVCTSVNDEGKPQVDGVYEITMSESAYRPSPLFVRHQDAHRHSSGTLIATALPTFADALKRVARDGLLDELAAAMGSALPRMPNVNAEGAAQHASDSLRSGDLERRVATHASHAPPDAHGPFSAQAAMMLQTPRTSSSTPRARTSAPAPARGREMTTRRPSASTSLRSSPLSPGWELEQLEMADLSGPLPFPEDEPGDNEGSGHGNDLDAAALAATFGLAPPRAPRGIAAEAAQPMAPRPTADGQAPSFLDALAKTSRATQSGEDTMAPAPSATAMSWDESTVAARPAETHPHAKAESQDDEPQDH